MITPRQLGTRAAAILLLALGSFMTGMWLGHDVATTQALAERAASASKALAQYQAAVKQGEQDTEALREQLRQQGAYRANLEERLRHAPPLAVAAGPACGALPGPGPVAAAAVAGAAAGGPAPGGPADEAADAAGSGGPLLTTAAVSLWNSALAGVDVPAGACRADALAEPACAVETTASLADAWANHATNAAACAEDRARLRGLIEHLRKREARP